MGASRFVRSCLSALVVLACASFALAQDYTVTAVSGKWVAPPATGATDLVLAASQGITTFNNLPFPVPYFGKAYTQFAVQSNGCVQFQNTPVPTYTAYPYPLTSTYDGFCSPCQSYYYGGNGAARCRWWVDGVAPDRRLIIAWTSYATQWSTTDTSINIQVQFNESSGRITMAYTGTWTATNSGTNGYGIYLDEPNASRFVRPPNGETNLTSYPGTTGVYTPPNDWQFDPKITSFTGTVKYDRLVADGTGLGNTVQPAVPLAGLRVELRDGSGAAVGFGTTDANGNYTVKGLALVGSTIGTIAVTSRSAACLVRPPYTSPSPATAPYSVTIATNVAFNASGSVGTYTIGAAADPTGSSRAALHIARSIQAAYDQVKPYTTDVIPELEVFYSSSAIEPSTYNRGGGPATASMVVGGAACPNPDQWDTGVVQRTYAHHLLASIASAQSTAFDSKFDSISDDQNAFAEGFGYYLAGMLSGSPNFYDTLSSSTATTINLEDPQPATRAGPDVTAWVAAALYDLADGANEAWDEVDGTGVAGVRPIAVVDALSSAPTAGSFYLKWGQLGFPGSTTLARTFIHYGAVADDASEANDRATEATTFAAPGFRRSNMVLNPYNEDWFQFQLTEAATGLAADISADFPGNAAVVTLELRNAADVVVATGSLQPGNISMRAVVPGSSPAGIYRVRVRHDSGGRIGSYAVQAYTPIQVTSPPFAPWTVGRPYVAQLTAKGGVPPYAVTIEQPFVKPPGLFLDSANLRVTGAPLNAGLQNFVLSVRDDGDPANVASVPQSFLVNEELKLKFGAFIAFAQGRPVDRVAPFTGGTAPLQFTMTEGAVPSGLTLDLATLRFHGTPTVAGSTYFKVDGIDVAGSADTDGATAVVAVPFEGSSAAVELAEGASACGFYFDAVAGSVVSLPAKTGKKQAKRALHMVILDPSGAPMEGVAIKAGYGSASASKILCPKTGRYFVVLSSDTGSATQLLGSVKLVLPKKAAGSEANFGQGDTLDVPMGVVAGARVTLTGKPDKTSGLTVRGILLRDPSGTIVPLQPGEVTDVNGAVVFTKVLPTSGTWTFTFAAKPGPTGTLGWSLKIVQPKGVTYSAD